MRYQPLIILILCLLWFPACDEFLTEEPQNDPTRTTFFGPNASEVAMEQLINGMYNSVIWGVWDRRWFWFTVAPADAFNHTTAYDTEGQEYDNHNFNSGQFNVFRMWNYVWWPIARANSYLANHDQLVELHGDQWDNLDRFQGEALFFRAFFHFQGMQAFGEIPLVVDEYPQGTLHGSSTYEALYAQIITDLNTIIDNDLLPNWTAFDGTLDEGRITRGAAKTLLAKVYLTRATSPAAQSGDFQQAAEVAQDVIDTEGYSLITSPDVVDGDTVYTAYEKVFLPMYENGPEGIYEFQFFAGNAGSPSKLNSEWVPSGFFNAGDGGKMRFDVTELLYNSFEEGDLRKKSYHTGTYFDHNTEQEARSDKIWMSKYQDPFGNTQNNFENNYIYLRYADLLLMHAEALNEANQGPTPEAYASINAVRNRAGLPDLSGLSYEAFQDAVRQERFIELAGEGWRLWDLRRWGFDYLKQRIEASNPNATVEAHEMLWPIPEYEIGVNPMINQNQGY